MDRRRLRLILIPGIIIGLTCILFLSALLIGYGRDQKEKREEYLKAVSSADAEDVREDDRQENNEPEASSASSDIAVSMIEGIYDDTEGDTGSGSRNEEAALSEEMLQYVLLLTSSESDLMIRMVGSDGRDAAGIPWKADITAPSGEGYETTDDDRDGLIYIDSLGSGEYTVEVSDPEGFHTSSKINIKPDIRYLPSAGIRSIVMQESQINAAVEDTALLSEEKTEEEEAGEPPSLPELFAGTMGIDVSKYNKEIDWNRVKASGIEFAIIRAGYRGSTSGVLVEDPYFKANLAGAKAAGMKIGVYFFTQAITEEEAREEAGAVATLVSAEDLSLPVFLDVESSGNANGGRADPLDRDSRTVIVKAFLDEARRLGYNAGVYANKTWMTNRLNMEAFEGYTKWLAQYRAEGPTYEGPYSIWQYTSGGAVDGITGRVDMNLITDPSLGL